jgi:hypothetical protein
MGCAHRKLPNLGQYDYESSVIAQGIAEGMMRHEY